VAKRRPSPKRRKKLPGEAMNVSRIEFENIEAVVRKNFQRLGRVEERLDTLNREIAELIKAIRSRSTG
jgi:hypothetical protein